MFFRLMPYSPVTAHWHPGQGAGMEPYAPAHAAGGARGKAVGGSEAGGRERNNRPLAGGARAPVGAGGDEGDGGDGDSETPEHMLHYFFFLGQYCSFLEQLPNGNAVVLLIFVK